MEELFYDAADVAKMLGISKSKAYTVIRALNKELADEGFMVIAGRVSKKFFSEKFYGMME
ncbi:MAG: DNA-binding protein [Lachnospiraceae bacterium]|nr:DNA-binding protein [Lachnospiraceae bacterium]